MAESLPAFVERRQGEWDELQRLLDALQREQISLAGLTALDRLYRRASADLAHAQAFFAGTDAQRFLNQLCARAYGTIYRPHPDRVAAMRRFFARTFPRTLRANLPSVRLALALVALGAVLGATTVLFEPALAEALVPQTVQTWVEGHRLWTDEALDERAPHEMAVAILTNNLRVTVLAFALGLTAGVLTVALLIFNGLQLGAVVAFCFKGGLGWGLLGFMAAHGWVELSIIGIAGGAGLMIGRAMIAPDERPRGEVISERAREAVQLVLGCAPFLALTGVVEGFVSPGDLFPVAARVAVGLLLGAAFWGYLLRAGRDGPAT